MPTLFGERLSAHALNPHALPAVVMPGREIGYRDLLGRVHSVATSLASQGCTPSEVVGICIADELTHLTTSLALLSLGIPQICLDTAATPASRLRLATRLGVRSVVVTDIRHALEDVRSLDLPTSVVAAGNGGSGPLVALAVDSDAPAVYFTSSGTTGEPKIFAMSQRYLARRAAQMVAYDRIDADFRALNAATIENGAATNKRLNCALLGFTSIFPGDPSSPTLSLPELCAQLDVTCLELNSLQANSMLLDDADLTLGSRTAVFISGSRVPGPLRRKFAARFGTPLHVHYGVREFGRISCTFPDSSGADDESVGRPLSCVELEIVDADNRKLPQGEVGQVRVRSELMLDGYHRDPAASARHFRHGWFYPGDLGLLTSAGALCLHGRGDDMMNLNSIKIFPAEIERVLEDHPAVKTAAAFARPSAVHGDIPLAAVELNAGATAGADELLRHARDRLGVRAPRKVIVLDVLPRSAAGKVMKRELAELALDGKPPAGA